MKKLMFAAALALGATCFADSIESNVVGYQNFTLNDGFTMFSPVFTSIEDENTIDIQEIRLICKDDDYDTGAGLDMLQTLNKNGGTYEKYYWVNQKNGFAYQDGWYTKNLLNGDESDLQFLVKKTFKPGDGLWIKTIASQVEVSVSGNVKLNTTEFDLIENGFTAVGNCTPLPLKLQDIKLVAQEGDFNTGAGLDMLQTLNVNGGTAKKYYWVNQENGFAYKDGWYTKNLLNGDESDLEYLADDTFQPGEGLWVKVISGKVKLTIPPVVLSK